MEDAQSKDDLTALLTTYDIIAQRRTSYDQMAWQTPVLSFTAQAFLFSIALGPGTSRFSRIAAAALAFIIAAASIQLMKKHLHLELIDSIILHRFEERLATYKSLDLSNPPHTPAELRRAGLQDQRGKLIAATRLERQHSPTVWIFALALFGTAAAIVMLLAAVDPALLS